MITFTDEMKQRINNAFADKKYCIWATASSDGVPSLGFTPIAPSISPPGGEFAHTTGHSETCRRSRM